MTIIIETHRFKKPTGSFIIGNVLSFSIAWISVYILMESVIPLLAEDIAHAAVETTAMELLPWLNVSQDELPLVYALIDQSKERIATYIQGELNHG